MFELGVSSTIDPVTTLGFLRGWSILSDNFLLVNGLTEPVRGHAFLLLLLHPHSNLLMDVGPPFTIFHFYIKKDGKKNLGKILIEEKV